MIRITGLHAVEAAIRADQGVRLTVRPGTLNERQAALVELARERSIDVRTGEIGGRDVVHQGVELQVREPQFSEHKALVSDAEEGGTFFLLLDGVTDARNFGACLRSAATFGVDGVVVPKDHSAPLNEAAIKTASGAASMLRLYRVTNLGRSMDALKTAGVWMVGTVLDEVPAISDLELDGRVGLVMGSEDNGIRHGVRERCDFLARIPMPGAQLSLNVSVATGIALYEVVRQRRS